MNRWFAWLASLAVLALAHGARADERILDFASDIAIEADGTMAVAETIRVRSEGDRIRHGIYRDFPTEYKDRFNDRVHVAFVPVSLTRDGRAEPYHTESKSNGVRVYFGSESTLVSSGEHTYVFRYRVTRELGFFDDHDELYWNVTGNGWDFAIDHASATVSLPDGVPAGAIHVEAYTGPQGAKGQAYSANVEAPARATFATTQPLGEHEGLTIVVGFPKGFVEAPTPVQSAGWFLADNAGVLVGLLGLIVVWVYYYYQWRRVGRDPKPGVVIPEYEAPDGLSPGTLRHVERMAWDNRCFAADVVDLGVRGALTITEDGSTYTIRRTGKAHADIPAPERDILGALLGGRNEIVLKQSNHTTIASALKSHRKALEANDTGRYFHTNSKLVIPGALACVLALGAGLLARGIRPELAGAGFMLVWLSMWTFGVVALVTSVIKAWRAPAGVGTYASALFLTFFSLPFIVGELVGVGAFVAFTGIGFAVVAIALIATNFAFFHWLKAPTPEGRKLMDRIAGLRLYLGVAERDELARHDAPPMTADEFEKFLPYALALGVEKTWADRFAAAVGPAAAAAAAGAMTWYHGSTGGFSNLSSFTSGLGSSLSGAISSSSSAPGSSSGGGGGGSSGGGGGGGGGGGW